MVLNRPISSKWFAAAFAVTALALVPTFPASAENSSGSAEASVDDAAELAKKLQNPIASLISVPIQSNFDFGAGPEDDGVQFRANIQPVIPITLNEDWNLISRTILPVVSQDDVAPGTDRAGLGDTIQSLFFSPQKPTANGIIWGAGPVLLLPTATDDLLGSEKWGAGPTAVVLKQDSGWTYGFLANHIWSFAGEDNRDDVSATFAQPFLGYTTKTFTTFTINTESTYDWENEQWIAPLNLLASQLVKIGGVPIQFQGDWRYYMEKPDFGPDHGVRFTVTFLFPR